MEIERRDIEWYEGCYQVSNTWLVKLTKEKILNVRKTKNNATVSIKTTKWKRDVVNISRLIASSFIRPLNKKELVIHIDWNTHNNNIDNLYIMKDKNAAMKFIQKRATVKINQYSLSWEYIQTFNSITEAAKSIWRKNTGNIPNVARWRRKNCYWYIRKYAE